MPRIFVTRRLPGRAIDLLRAAGHTVDLWEDVLPPPADVLRARTLAADAVLSLLTDRFDTPLLEAAKRLRIVANMAAGYDNIDPAAAEGLGIWVANTPGVLAETTADYAFALLMTAARNVVTSARDTLAGGWKTWSPTAFLGPDVHGSMLGIVGLGEIGAAMAKRARGFEMEVLYTSRTRKPAVERALDITPVELDELLARADFISLHVPLTPETYHLIGGRELALAKPSAILINTARGQVVQQDALVDALRTGGIAGAALDVTDPEPLPLDHPLFALPNVIITPHIASGSLTTRSRMAEMAARNILAALADEPPPNAVNHPEAPGSRNNNW